MSKIYGAKVSVSHIKMGFLFVNNSECTIYCCGQPQSAGCLGWHAGNCFRISSRKMQYVSM